MPTSPDNSPATIDELLRALRRNHFLKTALSTGSHEWDGDNSLLPEDAQCALAMPCSPRLPLNAATSRCPALVSFLAGPRTASVTGGRNA
jgi:hypothetical protein